jgi:hypothetical protein
VRLPRRSGSAITAATASRVDLDADPARPERATRTRPERAIPARSERATPARSERATHARASRRNATRWVFAG